MFSGSTLIVADQNAKIRLYTRAVEFDYLDWTLNALGIKISQASMSSTAYLNGSDHHQIVVDYLKLTEEIISLEYQIKLIFSAPDIQDPVSESQDERDQLKKLYDVQKRISPLAESILEKQISEVLYSLKLVSFGMPIPPVLFHITPLPYNLIVSPRDKILQETSISLVSDLPVDEQVELEKEIDSDLNVSSLVVPVGGIGSYPTMIERSTSLNWIANTIAHEWIHNWLTLRPLGLRYELNSELRTMNETTASIAGDEIGMMLINNFYPELKVDVEKIQLASLKFSPPDPRDLPEPRFDYRHEMHITRVEVDRLLDEGEIEAAENYMESRRQIFWDNGYAIRKLNQAYFAFYGAYADVPGGAAGEDPVGPAVRALRAQSLSLFVFLEKISKMTSYEELIAAVAH
jgi:hypothetical protein